jgi:hypothetical protein
MSDDLDPEDLAVIARLRALPTEGTEPAWDQFGRELARKLAAPTPRPWWRRWWAPALGATLATAAAGAVVLMWPQPTAAPVVVAELLDDAAPEPAPVPAPRPPRPGEAILALGAEGDIDDADLDLDDEDVIAGVIEALDEGDDVDEEDDEGEDLAAIGDVPEDPVEGLVPDLDLDWVDDLEDEDLDAVAAWLEDEAG